MSVRQYRTCTCTTCHRTAKRVSVHGEWELGNPLYRCQSCGAFNYETLEGTNDSTAAGTYTGKLYYYNNGNSPIMGKNGDLYTGVFRVVSGGKENIFTTVEGALENYATQ